MLSVDHKEDDDYSNVQREQTLRGILQWDHLRENWKVGAKAGYIHTWMAYDFEKSLGNGNMAQMIRSRSRIDTFFGQVEGEYSVGDKWLFTADLSVHQHLVESVDKNVLPMKDPQQLGGNRKKVQVGYDQGRVELSGYVSAKYQPTDRLGLSLALREEMFGDDWTPVIPAFFADYVLSHRGRVVAKASVSRNFRFPTLNDLYFLPGGNPDLKKEHGISYDGRRFVRRGARRLLLAARRGDMVRLLHRRLDRLAAHLQGILDSEEHQGGARLRRRVEGGVRLAASARLAVERRRQFLVDALDQQRRSGRLVRQGDRQATGLYPRIFGFGDRTVDLQVVEVHLQVVLLQRTLHHVGQQHEDEDRPRETLFHE